MLRHLLFFCKGKLSKFETSISKNQNKGGERHEVGVWKCEVRSLVLGARCWVLGVGMKVWNLRFVGSWKLEVFFEKRV
ncbi:MAG: hypothetical protein ACI9Y7_000934 [Dokdonia sp.]|jgi:hypothetical protein